MPSDDSTKSIVEALLFSADEPLPLGKMSQMLPEIHGKTIRKAVEDLRVEYDEQRRGFSIEEIAGGYQMFTRSEYAKWVRRLRRAQAESKLSQAALETLAVIAYKQPTIRSAVEAVRGVACGPIIRTLLDKKLIRITGRDTSLGRPILYGTTEDFLKHFGLRAIEDLPNPDDLSKQLNTE